MKKHKVAVLGAHGMLGSMVMQVLSQDENFSLVGTVRKASEVRVLEKKYPKAKVKVLDLDKADIGVIKKAITGAEWVINCIGILKPYISEDDPFKIERAIRINALFPQMLAQAALKTKAKVIQIETDCVFSGIRGNYIESDAHDPLDVYGKTKSLGETYYPNVYHLRCSIIGPEPRAHVSLLDWFLGQPQNAQVNGFTNHQWNGVTIFQFARICQGIIKKNPKLPRLQHVIPKNKIDKAKLLEAAKIAFNRGDIKVKPVKAEVVVDRTLSTNNKETNLKIWQAAGYKTVPTVEEMIQELSENVQN
ncbi:MAG: SDR family oxidoreductase [Patescibacteria group bacterium]|nr:SDR family oxidoreductase [Patescibacteria group bacterium]